MKIKLDENMPARLKPILQAHGHDVHTVADERLIGRSDDVIWDAACAEERLLVTQDLDFSDARRFAPGTHAGLLLVRLREPGAAALIASIENIAGQLAEFARCFVVLTDTKIRVKRP